MKVKEAPEKIYINSNLENRTWLIGKGDISFVEYTRTDAFIEKMYNWLKNYAFVDDNNNVNLSFLLHDFLKDSRNF